MDDDLYDEFGNYIGPEIEDEDDEGEEFPDDQMDLETTVGRRDGAPGGELVRYEENKIVLHEDKKYYPDASEVYPGVKTVTLDEDAQDLSEPIIKPIKIKNFSVLDKSIPSIKYSNEFLVALMKNPHLIRNFCILGHFHHGKTLFTDTLVMATHESEWDPTKEVRYSDTRKDEQERQLSIKSTPISLVLENLQGKSHLFNILDCPGHINFSDESTAAIRTSDGAVIIVDAIEGLMISSERLIKHALMAQIPICLVRVLSSFSLYTFFFLSP
jgi:U5 small nuclear ribonucleoprotein component